MSRIAARTPAGLDWAGEPRSDRNMTSTSWRLLTLAASSRLPCWRPRVDRSIHRRTSHPPGVAGPTPAGTSTASVNRCSPYRFRTVTTQLCGRCANVSMSLLTTLRTGSCPHEHPSSYRVVPGITLVPGDYNAARPGRENPHDHVESCHPGQSSPTGHSMRPAITPLAAEVLGAGFSHRRALPV